MKFTHLKLWVFVVGLFDDFNRFLESRLEEFCEIIHIWVEALLEQLRDEQEEDTLRLIDLQLQEAISDEILATQETSVIWVEKQRLLKTRFSSASTRARSIGGR